MYLTLLLQFLTLCLFTVFVGFCFCDGFRLHIARKLVWFITYILIVSQTLRIKNDFDLAWILPVPILLALLLCINETIRAKKKG
jgi:hypothetical protein